MINVLIVDDHPAVRVGLRKLIDLQPDLAVVGTVAGAEVALAVAERERVDVAVVDYQLAGHNGLWLSRKLARLPRPPRVLVFSAYSDGVLTAAAIAAQAAGVMSKGNLGAEVCAAVRTLAHGGQVLPKIPARVAQAMRERLEQDEQAAFGMVLAGMDTAEIGAALRLPPAGVESLLGRLVRDVELLPHRQRMPEPAVT